MRDEGIRALFVENITDPRLIQQLAREAGAVIGGTLYSTAFRPTGPAPTYLDMFRHNVSEIAKAFTIWRDLLPVKPCKQERGYP